MLSLTNPVICRSYGDTTFFVCGRHCYLDQIRTLARRFRDVARLSSAHITRALRLAGATAVTFALRGGP